MWWKLVIVCSFAALQFASATEIELKGSDIEIKELPVTLIRTAETPSSVTLWVSATHVDEVLKESCQDDYKLVNGPAPECGQYVSGTVEECRWENERRICTTTNVYSDRSCQHWDWVCKRYVETVKEDHRGDVFTKLSLRGLKKLQGANIDKLTLDPYCYDFSTHREAAIWLSSDEYKVQNKNKLDSTKEHNGVTFHKMEIKLSKK